jgi:hypothetical protein
MLSAPPIGGHFEILAAILKFFLDARVAEFPGVLARREYCIPL